MAVLNSYNDSEPVEIIFLGTGSSSSIPHVDCLTAPEKSCRTCLSTLTPEGKKNIRRNTSAVVRFRRDTDHEVTIVIDVGKNFQAAAVEWFPKHNLRRIDAVLITHAHADAMNGLDDLRAWTLHGAIQKYIDLYVSEDTFREVKRAFPYLVSKKFASGGGDVPEFKWHVIEEGNPFEIGETGIHINPFAVHHGRVFSPAPPVDIDLPLFSSPASSNGSSPNLPSTPVRAGPTLTGSSEQIQPYLCFGYVIDKKITYISDTSHIPEDVWDMLQSDKQIPPVFVLDCLRVEPHTSHLGVAQSVDYARRMGAKRTYLLGFSHELPHDDFVTLTAAVGKKSLSESDAALLHEHDLDGLRDGSRIWVRPAFDGLRVEVENDDVKDDGYD